MDWYFCTVNLSILLNLVFAFYFYLYSLDFFSEWFQSDVLIRNFNFSFWNFVFIFIERNYKRFSLELEKNIFFIKKSFRFNEWLYNIQSTQKLHINCIWYILLILHKCIILSSSENCPITLQKPKNFSIYRDFNNFTHFQARKSTKIETFLSEKKLFNQVFSKYWKFRNNALFRIPKRENSLPDENSSEDK